VRSPVEVPRTAGDLDTRVAAERMRDEGCAVIPTLGDGITARLPAAGATRAVPISTGTNNVFPDGRGNLAGRPPGSWRQGGTTGSSERQRKTIHVSSSGGPDLALIDVVLVAQSFTGARALWEPGTLRAAVLARAEPAATGISAVGGLLCPVGEEEDGALLLCFGPGGSSLRAPIAPGLYRDVAVRETRLLTLGEVVELEGSGVLAFDGERERILGPGQRAAVRPTRWSARDRRAAGAGAGRAAGFRTESAESPRVK
jgi:hypothetical protein